MAMVNCSTDGVFYNQRGQCVGALADGYLEKHVDSAVHQLHKPPAWCIDEAHLRQLRSMEALGVKLVDESGRTWTASVDVFERSGKRIERGHGAQIALPLGFWTVTSALQPTLFDLTGVA